MEKKPSIVSAQIITTLTFLIMITVNVLANTLPINGVTTGEVSDSYPNLFTPAAVTFSIWGVIYVLLTLYTLYQLGLFRGKASANYSLLRRIDILFSVSSLANAAWIICWHYYQIFLTLLLMLVILVCLIVISLVLKRTPLTAREKFFIRLPFSIYFGWITVATIANVTALLVSLGWNGLGIPDEIWTVVIIIIGMLIGVITMIRNRDFAYGLVLIWAYIGIYLKHTAPGGFNGAYQGITYTTLACLVLFIIAEIYVLFLRRRKQHRLTK